MCFALLTLLSIQRVATPLEDSQRRDFTVNALFYRLLSEHGTLEEGKEPYADPFGVIEDWVDVRVLSTENFHCHLISCLGSHRFAQQDVAHAM